jgi:alpha-ketoglutarate-dependent taurine dioxygenase
VRMSATAQSSRTYAVDRLRADLAVHGYLVLEGRDPYRLFDAACKIGEPALLRARDRQVSRGWSLSGSFGRSAFPWHTDGAISSRPPRWIVLRAVELSEWTSTELTDPSDGLLRSLQRTVLVARDRLGRARYLPAYVPMDHGHRVRWDPRTCRPRSEETAVEVAMTPPSAAIEWRPDLSVVIDNYRLMHRRPAVGAGAERVLERTYVWS